MGTSLTIAELLASVLAVRAGDKSARVRRDDAAGPDDDLTRLAEGLNGIFVELEAEKRSRLALTARFEALAHAARDFSLASHEPERLLAMVPRRLAEVLKDQCVLRMVSADGLTLVPAAVSGVDEEAERIMREVYADPVPLATHHVARFIHETGESVVAPVFDPDAVRQSTTPKFYEWAKRIGLHSVMMLPVRSDGTSYGQLFLSRYKRESPAFDEHDEKLARALADHAAIAIAKSRAYAAERAARAVAEEANVALQSSEMRYRVMFDKSPLAKWLYDAETLRFLDVNDAAVREYGYSREELLGMTIKDIRPPEDVALLLEQEKNADTMPKFGVWRFKKKGGEIISVEITKHSFPVAGRRCRLAVGRDVTERQRLEEQLRQAQKMEAVGRLAGGVAHDFNNVLSVVLGYADTLLGGLEPGAPMTQELGEIRRAASRAADLTRQLLMFSRQQVLAPRVVDLNEVLANMDRMLQRVLGADIELVAIPGKDLGRVRVDPTCIEQVIMNLVVNARDAMPTGGKLTMETANVVLDEDYANDHLGAKPGPHVMIAVTDTGNGMDKATLARIFEPFFTTKELGKGTGLGLSTVHGIAEQSGGTVWVYSEPGRGTTFKVYLPRVEGDAPVRRPSGPRRMVTGTETILLVEDDEQVRGLALRILRTMGYQVIEARTAGDALALAADHAGTIHLLLSDVVMPQMSGPVLAQRICAMRPDIKVLCMSGYTDDSIVRHGVVERQLAFVQKPFTPSVLAAKVREVLDGTTP